MDYNSAMDGTLFMRSLAIIVALSALVFFCCSRTSQEESFLLRLVDDLEEGNIIVTPFQGGAESVSSAEPGYPAGSYPLRDLGSGGNPFQLKRKLKLGGAEKTVLSAPPRSEYAFPIELSPDSFLEFGIGIIRDDRPAQEAEGISFRITLEAEGRDKTVFQEYLPFPEGVDTPAFSYERHRIPLPYALKQARLRFSTRGLQPHFAFWENPVIVRKNLSPRRVILISVDTLRADHLGCYGYDRATSPNIDALASESALLLNTYASSPWTLPSHVSMLTSLHGVRHQVYQDDEAMDPRQLTLADVFRANGFACGAFTGGGFVSAVYGFSKGFDSYHEGEGGVYHQDSAERVFRAAADWIDHHRDRDFFLFIHTYQPHSPYACPPPYKVMFLKDDSLFGHVDLMTHLGGKPNLYRPLPAAERQNIIDLYDGEIRYTDEKLIGSLMTKLKDEGLYEQSLIVFTSDHGEEFYEHGGWGHGHSLYDEALRVPLIIKLPQQRYAGQRSTNIVSLVDLMPTLLELTGCDATGFDFDGHSLLPVLRGREEGDRTFLADIGANILNSRIPQRFATNRDRFKLILNRPFSPDTLAFFSHPPVNAGAVELYDLASDPLESINVADQNGRLAQQLVSGLNRYYSSAVKRQAGKAEMTESLRQQLRALGYIR